VDLRLQYIINIGLKHVKYLRELSKNSKIVESRTMKTKAKVALEFRTQGYRNLKRNAVEDTDYCVTNIDRLFTDVLFFS